MVVEAKSGSGQDEGAGVAVEGYGDGRATGGSTRQYIAAAGRTADGPCSFVESFALRLQARRARV